MRHGIGWMLQIGVRALWATAVRPPWSTGYAAAFSGADYARLARRPEGRAARSALHIGRSARMGRGGDPCPCGAQAGTAWRRAGVCPARRKRPTDCCNSLDCAFSARAAAEASSTKVAFCWVTPSICTMLWLT